MIQHPDRDRSAANRQLEGVERLAWFAAVAVTVWALAFHLGTIPDGCYHDEVSIGFNARSIWRTGADQYGVSFPLYYRGIGDWKGPLPLYAIMLSTAVLGNTPVALRVPGLIFAAGMATLLGCCIRALTRDRRLALWLGLFSLSVPSIFFYARSGTAEPACFPFFTTLALFAVLRFELQPTRQRAAAAGALLALGAYAYPAARLFMPTAAAAAVVCLTLHPPTRRHVWITITAGIATAIPLAVFMARHPDALFVRLRGMSIFAPNASHLEVAELFACNYLSHFGLDFLFRTGQKSHHHWHNIGTGFISLWMLFPLVFGMLVLVRQHRRPFYRFLLLVLLAAPIPAAMTTDDVPHPNRIIHLVPILVLVCALGVEHLLAQLRPSRRTIAALLALVSFEGAAMANQYFTEFPHVFDGDNPGGSDHGMGAALRLAFAERPAGAPMYLPPPFFDFDGMLVGFWGDLDPKGMRAHGLAGSGVHSTDEPGAGSGLPAGTLWIAEGTGGPPFSAEVVGAVERRPDSGGGTIWTIYRKR
jgi:hypothetical protein